ncbi:MAG: hypothetical protein ACRCYP_07100 [Alphaproteobacteria bacterium]
MKKLLFLSVLLGSFYMTQEAVAAPDKETIGTEKTFSASICHKACSRIACGAKEVQDACKNCHPNTTTYCMLQKAKPAKELAEKARKAVCYGAFNRWTCLEKTFAKIAKKICQIDEIKNCLKAANLSPKAERNPGR